MSLNIILYTPNKTMCNTVSEEIFLPTPDGEICIQPRHQQLVSALSIGLLRFKEGSAWNLFVVMGGISNNISGLSLSTSTLNTNYNGLLSGLNSLSSQSYFFNKVY